METAIVRIVRQGHDLAPTVQSYEVPRPPRATVMQALQYVYDHLDSSLAFRCGCRYRRCGLCAATVDGRPRLPCTTALPAEVAVGPLAGLPVLRDLVVDRSWVMRWLARDDVHIRVGDHRVGAPVFESAEHRRLMECTECLGCLASCDSYCHGDPAAGGPFHFVKLAQLHHDSRDHVDRPAQARALGIARCADCHHCHCLLGLPIRQLAIAPLLEGARR